MDQQHDPSPTFTYDDFNQGPQARSSSSGRQVTIAAENLNVSTVMEELDKITKEIEELQVRNVGEDDPEYKENAKKLLQIRKYLKKKTKPATPSKMKFWNKFKRIRQMRPSDMEQTPSEMMEIEIVQGGSSNYSSYSVDDAFLYGAECILSLLNMIKNQNE